MSNKQSDIKKSLDKEERFLILVSISLVSLVIFMMLGVGIFIAFVMTDLILFTEIARVLSMITIITISIFVIYLIILTFDVFRKG